MSKQSTVSTRENEGQLEPKGHLERGGALFYRRSIYTYIRTATETASSL